MSKYIFLGSVGDPDFYGPPQPPERTKMFAETVNKFQIKLLKIWTTMGDYDLVFEFEAPSDAHAWSFGLGCAKTWKLKTKILSVLGINSPGGGAPEEAVRKAFAEAEAL